MLLHIAFYNVAAKAHAATLTIFEGILLKFIAFLVFIIYFFSSCIWKRRYVPLLRVFLDLLNTLILIRISFYNLLNNPTVFSIIIMPGTSSFLLDKFSTL